MGTIELIPSVAATFISATPYTPSTVTGLVAAWDFADIATLWQDTARSSAITADGQAIKGVTDKSGNGHHLSEATNGPTYIASGQNSNSVARFNGSSSRLLTIAAFNQALPWTVVFAHKRTSTAHASTLILDNNAGVFLQTSANAQVQLYLNTAGNGGTLSTAFQQVACRARSNGTGNSTTHIDGGSAVFNANIPGTATFDSTTGIGATGVGGSPFHDGDIGEVLVYDGILALSDVNTLGTYLATKWGLSWTTAV